MSIHATWFQIIRPPRWSRRRFLSLLGAAAGAALLLPVPSSVPPSTDWDITPEPLTIECTYGFPTPIDPAAGRAWLAAIDHAALRRAWSLMAQRSDWLRIQT